MRKVILIGTMILVSMAAAQAGESRSLSLANSDITATAAPRPVADVRQTAEVVQLPPPVAQPAPAPAAVAPAPVQTASVAPTAPAAAPIADASQPRAGRNSRRSARASQPRHKRWTEARIIGELHRHGIYW